MVQSFLPQNRVETGINLNQAESPLEAHFILSNILKIHGDYQFLDPLRGRLFRRSDYTREALSFLDPLRGGDYSSIYGI